IEGFNHRALLGDQPLGELSDAFVPIYLLTRFQINAAAKLIGGANYSFVQDKTSSWHFVAPEQQKAALKALLDTLMPESLDVPINVIQYLVPKSGNYQATRESFASGIGVLPDQLGMAEVLSRHTVTNLLTPKRLNRVNQAYITDREQLSVSDLVNELLDDTLLKRQKTNTQTGIWMRVNAVVADALLQTVRDPNTAPEIQALLSERLQYAVSQLKRKAKRADDYQAAHLQWLAKSIEKGLTEVSFKLINKPLPMPPGSPI
ncbi:MAG: metalloprotease, partial [Shewanella sp.]|nr:metalloprotease [Shewanella sp.]